MDEREYADFDNDGTMELCGFTSLAEAGDIRTGWTKVFELVDDRYYASYEFTRKKLEEKTDELEAGLAQNKLDFDAKIHLLGCYAKLGWEEKKVELIRKRLQMDDDAQTMYLNEF